MPGFFLHLAIGKVEKEQHSFHLPSYALKAGISPSNWLSQAGLQLPMSGSTWHRAAKGSSKAIGQKERMMSLRDGNLSAQEPLQLHTPHSPSRAQRHLCMLTPQPTVPKSTEKDLEVDCT